MVKSVIKKYKKISINAGALFFLQVSNYIIPLIALPFLSRTLGPEIFGLLLFSQVLNGYFLIINEYGFNFIGTRQIAIHRHNAEKINLIFSSILAAKFLLLLFSLFVLIIIVLSFDRFTSHSLIYYYSFGIVIGNSLFPVWYYQGIEKMELIAIINFISRCLYLVCIILFVQSGDDYLMAAGMNSLSYILSGGLALLMAVKKFSVRLIFPRLDSVTNQFKEGWHVFTSNLSIGLYGLTNSFVLGIITNNTMVGYYVSAEKIVQALKFMFNPLFQAIFPSVARTAVSSPEKLKKALLKLSVVLIFVSTFLWVNILFFSEEMILLILGEQYLKALVPFKILSILILATPITYVIFNILFLSFKLERYSAKIYSSSALVNLILLSILLFIFNLDVIGAAISNIVTQLLVLALGVYVAKKRIYR